MFFFLFLIQIKLLRSNNNVGNEFSGWRRSHRPSLYDISIIDEKEEREDPEMQTDEKTAENTNSNAHKPPPVYTITK